MFNSTADLDELLPRLKTKVELIFAAYPNLSGQNNSQLKTLELLSTKLKTIARLEQGINIFTAHNWQQLTIEKYDGVAWANLFYLQLRAEADPSTALAEIKKTLQGTYYGGAWFLNKQAPTIVLSGSKKVILNQLGIQGAWIDRITWPLTTSQMCGLKAEALTEIEYLIGGTCIALELILTTDV